MSGLDFERPFVVYKLGGSLLDLPGLAERLRLVWRHRPDADVLLVVGGGAAADAVRDWDRVFQLGPEVSHWLAVDALELSARLLEVLVPELQLVRSLGQMRSAHAAGRPALLCVRCFMKWLETQSEPLPHTWDVTSDSIAAAVTSAWRGRELMLLKSCDLGTDVRNWTELAGAGSVDVHFPGLASRLPAISWVNLRQGTEVQSVRLG